MAESETEHKWVNKWWECDDCNYNKHRCHFCGTDLDHESYGYNLDHKLVRHWLSDCRPDLVKHDRGPLCTWPAFEQWTEEENREHGRPNCYAYQDRKTLDWGIHHIHFYTDGPMA